LSHESIDICEWDLEDAETSDLPEAETLRRTIYVLGNALTPTEYGARRTLGKLSKHGE
jgi:hypothetical protein